MFAITIISRKSLSNNGIGKYFTVEITVVLCYGVANKNQGTNEMINRDNKVDLLKTIAVLCVITIHVTSYGWDRFTIGTFSWTANMFWASVTRAAVPLFLMCSGAIFLAPGRELTIKKLYTRYLPRVIAAMLVWAMAYKISHMISGRSLNASGLLQALKEVLIFNQEFHLYYIHIIILVYVYLPVIRLVTANATKKQLEYCIAVWFALGILYPTVGGFWPISLISGFPRQWMINMTYAAIGYLILGYYVRYVSTFRRSHYLAMLIGGFLVVFFGTWYMCVRNGYFYDGFLGGMSVGVALMAAGISGVCPDIKSRPVEWCSGASFCIYLVHVFFLHLFEKAGFTISFITPALSAPVITAAIFLCSSAVCAVLSRIPIVNKWLI